MAKPRLDIAGLRSCGPRQTRRECIHAGSRPPSLTADGLSRSARTQSGDVETGFTRRSFVSALAKAPLLAWLPAPTRSLLAQTASDSDTVIEEVEVVRITGPFTSVPGLNRQFQAQAIHIYEQMQPEPFTNPSSTDTSTADITQHYLRIRTTGGIEGLYGYIDSETVTPILTQLRPFLIGRNAMAVEQLWDQMYRMNRHSRAGHYMMALSAVDNTLWDIRAKYFGVPVFELLGGPTRAQVRVYGSCLGYPVAKGEAGPRAKTLFDQGFVQQKWFLPYGPGNGTKGLLENIELVRELREAVGEEGEFMFDAFMGWDPPYARAWAKAVEQYRPLFIEEPFAPNRLGSFVDLARSTSVPVATGEHFYNRWEVLDFLEADAIGVVQADPEWCGGVSELVKICHLASSFGAKVLPHGHGLHAALHVVASQSPEVSPYGEYLINVVGYKLHFQKDPLLTDNGIIELPRRPGFGIVLDEDKIREQVAMTEP